MSYTYIHEHIRSNIFACITVINVHTQLLHNLSRAAWGFDVDEYWIFLLHLEHMSYPSSMSVLNIPILLPADCPVDSVDRQLLGILQKVLRSVGDIQLILLLLLQSRLWSVHLSNRRQLLGCLWEISQQMVRSKLDCISSFRRQESYGGAKQEIQQFFEGRGK
jgi:hypothetical protein